MSWQCQWSDIRVGGFWLHAPCEPPASVAGMVMRSHDSKDEMVVPRDHLTQEPHLKPLLLRHARRAWCTAGHPGWGFYTYNGRGSVRMPPESAGRYSVDLNRIPCFTPDEYAAATGGGGAAAAAADIAAAGATRGGGSSAAASAASARQAQEHSARSAMGAGAAAASATDLSQRTVFHVIADEAHAGSQSHRGYAAASGGFAASAQDQATPGSMHTAQAHQPASPGAALAAATLIHAAVTGRVPQEALACEHGAAGAPVGAPLESLVPHLARGSLAVAAGQPTSSWMNTHGLAAAAAAHAGAASAARTVPHSQPLALFQPSGQQSASAGSLVRPRNPGEECTDGHRDKLPRHHAGQDNAASASRSVPPSTLRSRPSAVRSSMCGVSM